MSLDCSKFSYCPNIRNEFPGSSFSVFSDKWTEVVGTLTVWRGQPNGQGNAVFGVGFIISATT